MSESQQTRKLSVGAQSERSERGAVSREHRRFLRRTRCRSILITASQVALLVVLLALWEIAASREWINSFITSQPSRVWQTAMKMAVSGELWAHLGQTVAETVAGFTIGTILGVVIAVILWWFDLCAKVCEPYIVILNSIPKVALGPIFIVWLGTNVTAIVAMALAISVIVTVMMVHSGLREVDPNKIKLVRSFGATKGQILRKVVLPGSIPTIVAALKVNVGLSFVGTIVGEFLVSRAGLGFLIVYGGQVFNMSLVMSSVIILCVVSALLYYLVSFLESRIVKGRSTA